MLSSSDLLQIVRDHVSLATESIDQHVAARWPVWSMITRLTQASESEREQLMVELLQQQTALQSARADIELAGPTTDTLHRFQVVADAVNSRTRMVHDLLVASADAAMNMEPFAVREDAMTARIAHDHARIHQLPLDERVLRLEQAVVTATLELRRARDLEATIRAQLGRSLAQDAPDGALAIRHAQARQAMLLERRRADLLERELQSVQKLSHQPMQLAIDAVMEEPVLTPSTSSHGRGRTRTRNSRSF